MLTWTLAKSANVISIRQLMNSTNIQWPENCCTPLIARLLRWRNLRHGWVSCSSSMDYCRVVTEEWRASVELLNRLSDLVPDKSSARLTLARTHIFISPAGRLRQPLKLWQHVQFKFFWLTLYFSLSYRYISLYAQITHLSIFFIPFLRAIQLKSDPQLSKFCWQEKM